ncbi:hypothetical protein D3C81_882550 [compost metagenome]
MKITIQAALNEMKLLDKKIKKFVSDAAFVGVSIGTKPVQGYKTNEDYINRVKSNLQSVTDLIKRREEIKAAVVASNAVTKIRVGEVEMTLAAALERKGSKERRGSIDYEKDLLGKLVRDNNTANAMIEKENRNLEAEISQKADIMLGKDSIKADPSQIEEVRKLLLAQKEPKLIDPIGVQALIDKLSEQIEEFEAHIDAAISESNAVTKIEISGPESNPQQ